MNHFVTVQLEVGSNAWKELWKDNVLDRNVERLEPVFDEDGEPLVLYNPDGTPTDKTLNAIFEPIDGKRFDSFEEFLADLNSDD